MQKEAWNMLNCLSWFLWEGLEEGHAQGLGWRQDPFMACVPVPLVLPASGTFLLLLGLGSLFWEEGEGQVLMGSEVLNWWSSFFSLAHSTGRFLLSGFIVLCVGFPGGSVVKNPPATQGT